MYLNMFLFAEARIDGVVRRYFHLCGPLTSLARHLLATLTYLTSKVHRLNEVMPLEPVRIFYYVTGCQSVKE